MVDFALYGHLVFDTIVSNKIEFNTGGIANVWRSLKTINPNYTIHIAPTNIGYSTIQIDTVKCTRESDSDLNSISIYPETRVSRISHIAYINEIKDLSFIQNLRGIVCADVCSGSRIDSDVLEYIDYLFVSEEDLNLINNFKKIKGRIVVHSPQRSYYLNGYEYKGTLLSNLNVLGAGDFFAAYYMHCLLNNETINHCLALAHKKTTNYLRVKNEKT